MDPAKQPAEDWYNQQKPKPDSEKIDKTRSEIESLIPTFVHLQKKAQEVADQVSRLERDKDVMEFTVMNRVYDRLGKRLAIWTALMIWTVLLTLGCAVLVYMIQNESITYVDKSIAKRFSDERIQNVIEDVAATNATEMIQTQIEPLSDEVFTKVDEFSLYINEAKKQFDEKYDDLSQEIVVMDARREVLTLSDQAIQGSRLAYKELLKIRDDSEYPDLRDLAAKHVEQVVAFYQVTDRIAGFKLNHLEENGVGLIDEAIPTEALVDRLIHSPHWKERAKAARILGDRVETPVTEALLLSIEKDPFLDVLKEAILAFSKVTGFAVNDPFDPAVVSQWWQENLPPGEQASETKNPLS